ncbi:MAG: hypothetical protein JNG86_00595 [Verrucomicrobiaceae bacterium]|nr:hypothetical protein [Verrucomicrobiaceae bacterium]
MRGNKVRGGDVPLYMPGGIRDFFRAGLILPGSGGYARAEYDVLDIGDDGRVVPSSGRKGVKTVAQVAIPSTVSSFDLSRTNIEMRGAVPATEQDRGPLRPAAERPVETPMLADAPKAKPVPSQPAAPFIKVAPAPSIAVAKIPAAEREPPTAVIASARAATVPAVPLLPPRTSSALLANRYFQAGPAAQTPTPAPRVASIREAPLLADARGHITSPVGGGPPSSARWISNPHFQVVSSVQ